MSVYACGVQHMFAQSFATLWVTLPSSAGVAGCSAPHPLSLAARTVEGYAVPRSLCFLQPGWDGVTVVRVALSRACIVLCSYVDLISDWLPFPRACVRGTRGALPSPPSSACTAACAPWSWRATTSLLRACAPSSVGGCDLCHQTHHAIWGQTCAFFLALLSHFMNCPKVQDWGGEGREGRDGLDWQTW